jgi:SNF2 family DNA or RNA helicase
MCPDIQYVATVSQFSTKLIQKSAFIPQIIMNDTGAFFIRWIPALFNEQVRKNYELLIQRCPDKIVTHNEHPIRKEAQVASLISAFISDAIHPSPYHTDPVKTSSDKDIYNLFFRKEPFRTLPLTAQVPIAIRNWLSNFYFSKRDHTLYLMIKEEGLENFSININVGMENKALPIPLLTALKTKNTTLRSALLSNISLLCSYIPCLATVIDTQKAALLNFESFGELFLKIFPIMQVIGVEVILPKSLKNALHPKLNLKLTSKKKTQSRGQSLLNLATLLDFNWQVAIGEKIISPEAFKQLLTTSRGLIRFGDKYLVLEEAEIKALLKKLNALPEKLSNFDLLQATLGHEYEGAIVSLDEPLQKFILQAITPSLPQAPPCNLKAQLRPYQIKGFNWLLQNINAGFGSILADDMGLGKTLQIITTLLHLKNNNHLNNENQALIVVPTSLISNWCKEVAKFAPDLTISPYYGNKRELSATSDIIITSYGIIRRDSKNFNEKSWLLMIIDEAQNIKTPTAAQTKQVKLIDARHKIALSGTPVENRLSEYWSIFDFTNAGYLKTIGHFNKHYSIPIEEERDGHCLERFKKITAPFILRRVKSDKSIIGDLPQKIEKNQYCSLTTEQAALYEEVVNNAWQSIESSEGMARRGLILKLITSLKQVCNHPASFTKKKLNFKTSTAQETVIQQSGKLQALQELLSEIELSEEKTLIFTQYVEMGILLQQVLSTEETRIPFLYGDLSRTERDAIIESFQTSNATRILIVSLKAGGTGLNLTAANHIIHYDLWWNPAVEAQATDRAYRIGQNKNVMVHRLIVSGTFEEKIDALIQSKKELADLTLGKGESWITEMKPSELHELIALRKATTD